MVSLAGAGARRGHDPSGAFAMKVDAPAPFVPDLDRAFPSAQTDSFDAKRLVVIGGAIVFLLLLLRTAWIGDDSYITFRTIDNFFHGFGLRWNVANRVDTYTHPLWMLVMIVGRAVTGEVYYTAIAISIVLSMAVVFLIGSRIARSVPAAAFALSALVLSKGFLEYSTSGLENPLTNLLLLAFFLTWRSGGRDHPKVFSASLCVSLLMLNRLDAGLLVVPALAVTIWQHGAKRSVVPVVLGFLPLIAWEVFSLVYYGFLVPNTAYAKLATGIPHRDLVQQGLLYVLDAVDTEPLTIGVIVAAIVSPLLTRRDYALPVGIALYLAYVVWVGGDLMTGRFLSAPFLVSVVHLLSTAPAAPRHFWTGATAAVWLLGFIPGWPTNFSGATYGQDMKLPQDLRPTDIDDQRRLHFPQTGLLSAHRGVEMPNHRWLHIGYGLRQSGQRIYTTSYVGLVGYGAGPGVYILDRVGLGDPLLARLPADSEWRIGHYPRQVPAGYEDSILSGENRIRDSAVAAYYDKLRIITEGPVWSRRRFQTILRMNLGAYDRYVADYGLVRLQLDAIAIPKPNGTPWDSPANVVMTPRGVEVAVQDGSGASALELSVSDNDVYTVQFLDKGREIGRARLVQPNAPGGALMTHTVAVPAGSFDAIRVRPSEGDFHYSLGHLRLLRKAPQ